MSNSKQKKVWTKIITPVALAAAALVTGYGMLVMADDSSGKPERQNHHEHLLLKDMYTMSSSVITLFALDNMEGIDAAERQKRVLGELDKLEQVARILVNNVEIHNYSVRGPFMGSFLHDVGMAREFALMDPPNFKPSTGLIKSCLLCHESLE